MAIALTQAGLSFPREVDVERIRIAFCRAYKKYNDQFPTQEAEDMDIMVSTAIAKELNKGGVNE